jgi:DNA-binding transcriptional MerR regulator
MSDFIKKSDVARIASVSIRTVENWQKNGLLPYMRIRGVVRYRRQDVEDALEAFIVNPRTRNRETTN